MTTALGYPNWFAMYADQYFARHLRPYVGAEDLTFLQIGAYTGDASTWLVDNILTGARSVLHDVDTWEGSDEPDHKMLDWMGVEETYDSRCQYLTVKHKTTSAEYLRGTLDGPFDFIYIDGDHHAAAVLSDAVLAWPLLKVGGLMAFDDYQWGLGAPIPDRPQAAVDAFCACWGGRLSMIDAGLQVWVRKERP